MADAIYNEFKERLGDGGHDLDTDHFNIALHGSNFVNDSAHDYWDDISATQTSGKVGSKCCGSPAWVIRIKFYNSTGKCPSDI